MVMTVIKRNGMKVAFDKNKISNAIKKAFQDIDNKTETEIQTCCDKIATEIANSPKESLTVEEIQDMVEKKLMASSYKEVAQEYTRYRILRQHIKENEKTNNSILNFQIVFF